MRKERVGTMFGGLAGFISIAFIQLFALDKDKLDLSLNIAMYSFSVALPLTIFYFISAQTHLKGAKTKVPHLYESIASITGAIAFLGIVALFSHYSLVLAGIFGVTSFVAASIFNKLDETKDSLFSLDVVEERVAKDNKSTSLEQTDTPKVNSKVTKQSSKRRVKSSQRKAT